MAKINVPGLKKSAGIVASFEPLDAGEYTFEIKKFDEKNLRDNSPGTSYSLFLKVLAGPPQKDGSPAKGKTHWHNIDIKSDEHPDMNGKPVEDQPGIHDLKALILAAGIELKGDSFNPDSFIGATVGGRVTQSTSKSNNKIYANIRGWYEVAQ